MDEQLSSLTIAFSSAQRTGAPTLELKFYVRLYPEDVSVELIEDITQVNCRHTFTSTCFIFVLPIRTIENVLSSNQESNSNR
jgi:hypothetical protein